MRKNFLNPNFTFIDRKKDLTHVVIGICPEKFVWNVTLGNVRPENVLDPFLMSEKKLYPTPPPPPGSPTKICPGPPNFSDRP
jgi:hypothetical protein